MDFEEVIKKRRSVRSFKPIPVEEEKIKKILALVNLAPSAGNLQAYKIFVVKNKKIIEKIAKVSIGMSHFKNLPPLILIFCANPKESAGRYGKRGEKLYSIQDATIACSYAQLIITSLGLSSCWVGAFEEKEIQKILKTDLLPVAILPVGYPNENPSFRLRKSLEELVKELT